MRTTWSCLAVCGLSLMLFSASAQAADKDMKPLFNGKNFDGWVQKGGKAEYTIEGDEIVGTSVPATGNSFLCTDRDYDDFIFEVEFKVDPLLNSGIQFRSHVYDEPKTYSYKDAEGKDKEKKVEAKRVHGYQFEIDPSDRAWSGGIYDEGRRAWLFNLAGDEHAEARKAFKQNEWNQVRIEAIGDSIKTYLNGVPVTNLTDNMDPSGFIALQVHGVGKSQEKVGKQVRWKNPRIKEIKK